jgi:2C-methyl-D-erythritol 2,4-cyclodiphosphate synthase
MKPVERNDLFDNIVAEVELDDMANPLTNYVISLIEQAQTLDHLKHDLQNAIAELYDIIMLISVKYAYETDVKLIGEIN